MKGLERQTNRRRHWAAGHELLISVFLLLSDAVSAIRTRASKRHAMVAVNLSFALIGLLPVAAFGQQVVQRGPGGKPAQVLDETQQWSYPILVSSDHDVEMYIPDVTSPDWLSRNYTGFEDKGQFVLSMFTFYRTPAACRINQIAWGFSDGAHVDACIDIGYRIRKGTVDVRQKTVTLIMAAMVGQDGRIDQESIQREPVTRTWTDLDVNTQRALEKSIGIISEQMRRYDIRINSKK